MEDHFEPPKRYELRSLLGRGGGGAVWAAFDHFLQQEVAIKVLSGEAGESERNALIREATMLVALEGLGVPQILAFGVAPSKSSGGHGTHFLVRELVPGRSLAEAIARGPIADAELLRACLDTADQLTTLHRAGILHGDIKPENIILKPDGSGTLVDLGLAVEFGERGALAKGFTPAFAAPELVAGGPLTLRTEVYSLAATLLRVFAHRNLEDSVLVAKVHAICTQSVSRRPSERAPSVDEFAAALRALFSEATPAKQILPWPIYGLPQIASDVVRQTSLYRRIELVGARESGRSALLRRLSWMLGIEGLSVIHDSARRLISSLPAHQGGEPAFILIDDAGDVATDQLEAVLRSFPTAGIVLVREPGAALLAEGHAFEIPRLGLDGVVAIVRRALPNLDPTWVKRLHEASGGLPGRLRRMCGMLVGRLIAGEADLELILASVDATQNDQAPEVIRSDEATVAHLADVVRRGRFVEAAEIFAQLRPVDRRLQVARLSAGVRIALARGDLPQAEAYLVELQAACVHADAEELPILAARVAVRRGAFVEAVAICDQAIERVRDASIRLELFAVRAVGLAYAGDDAKAVASLSDALIAMTTESEVVSPFAHAIAVGSLGVVHQRAGRLRDAKTAYLRSLELAKTASDAWTLATMHLNVAGILQGESLLGDAIRHLESAVETGVLAGATLVVLQARLNLVGLELHIGRYAKAALTLASVEEAGVPHGSAWQAQYFGLRGEHATKVDDVSAALVWYEKAAICYRKNQRATDALEVDLYALLALFRQGQRPMSELLHRMQEIMSLASNRGAPHESLADYVEALILEQMGDASRARERLDEARERELARKHRDVLWHVLAARGELSLKEGSRTLAERDFRDALTILEEGSVHLTRDLREVFWSDPRRATVRSRLYGAGSGAVVGGVLQGGAHPSSTGGASMHSAHRGGGIGSGFRGTDTLHESGQSRSQFFRSSLSVAEDRLSRVLEITRELARERSLPRLLEQVTDHAIALLRAERGFIVLTDSEGRPQTSVARGPRGTDLEGTFSRSVAERVLRDGEPLVLTNAQEDAQLRESASVHQMHIQSVACVPIRGAPPSDLPIGVLYLETRLRRADDLTRDLSLLSAFADQAAIAIESARLNEQAQKRAEDLELANRELNQARARLELVLERKTEQLTETRKDLRRVREALRSRFGYGELVGTSEPMRKLYALIERLKDTHVPVLVTGESGTGKEVVARTIHAAGARAKSPYYGVNCGAIPANLLESELFGHEKGAFTGADRARTGLFRDANGGTILLDEVGEMPLAMQPSLLRVLQERTVRPLGSNAEIAIDVRVIAATNRKLPEMIAAGEFREDLFYRLHVVEIAIPPLRDRIEDIPLLVDHFLGLFAIRHQQERKHLAREALAHLQRLHWPGNVRQLEHVLLNAWLLSDDHEIGLEDFASTDVLRFSDARAAVDTETSERRPSVSPPRASSLVPAGGKESIRATVKGAEAQSIREALVQCKGNRLRAAELLGMPRRTFYRRLKEFGLLDD
jgi:serine/threonine-protein kinase PknK